ncbi:MAG: N-acetylmuramoyl-L-alanine amidase, partial [Bacteroidales bacterium]
EDEAYITPNETRWQMYQTDLLFGLDEGVHDSIEFYYEIPDGVYCIGVYLILQDLSPQLDELIKRNDSEGILLPDRSCPALPTMIPRSSWCGSYSACQNPTYTPTYISATHTVIHHGASPDSYTDGAAVVRSYWNYHVNTNGWSDIGYNYLFDKTGNMYVGRYNPNLPNSDVRGAHAGSSNSYSIGLNYLGNSDASGTAPTTAQNNKCCQFMAWWYDHKGFDPTSSASILCQDNVTRTIKRICGHRDVNPGGTTCPGNALYALLPTLRTNTQQIIEDCNISPLTVIITASQQAVCSGQSVILTASGATTYHWSTNQTGDAITVFPTNTTTYSVTGYDVNNNSATASINIIVYPNPNVNLGNDTAICHGPFICDVSNYGYSSYSWNIPGYDNSPLIINQTGIYSITVTDNNGCSASDSIIVIVYDLDINLEQINENLIANINPIINGYYTWYNCEGFAIPNINGPVYFNAPVNGCFYVIFTDYRGCQWQSDSLVVTNINDYDAANTIIYPNPASTSLYIQSLYSQNADIYFYNAIGQLVKYIKMDKPSISIDVSNLNGIYLLKIIYDESKTNFYKILINNL